MFNVFSKKIDFSQKSERELMTCFKSDTWNKLGRANQINLLQNIENKNAEKQNREPCKVVPVGDKDFFGRYNDNKNKIEINLDKKTANGCKNDSYQIMDSIYHEGQHAYQDVCLKENRDELPKQTLDMCKIENLKITKENKQKGEEIGSFYIYEKEISYNNCTCERDSQNAAAKKIMENGDLFREDPEYHNYLKQKRDDYTKLNNIDTSEIKKQQAETVYQALQRKDIDMKQHDQLINEIWKSQEQPTFAESKELQNQIHKEELNAIHSVARKRDAEHYANYTTDKENQKREFQTKYDYKKEEGIPPGYDDELELLNEHSKQSKSENPIAENVEKDYNESQNEEEQEQRTRR